ncbi:MAG: DUF4881 domain-containing protein [Candidatus Sulfopaludibacter sp.]|nr:DUF4881 domain-containing protein [Candidatus Sulfopaludibacter sp.]
MCDRRVFLVGAAALWIAGCNGMGSVEQGRVIGYDRTSGQVTLIRDSTGGKAPQALYDALPPVSVKSPGDPQEMGPEPQAGKLMGLDLNNRLITIYDSAAKQFRTIPYTPLEVRHNVARGTGFPLIDKEKRTVSLFWRDEHTVITFPASDDLLALPADTWKGGDVVRYYFKSPGQALRMMNVTRTDLSKS